MATRKSVIGGYEIARKFVGTQEIKAEYCGDVLFWERGDNDINIVEDFICQQLRGVTGYIWVKGEGTWTITRSRDIISEGTFSSRSDYTEIKISGIPGRTDVITLHGVMKDIKMESIDYIETPFPKSMILVRDMNRHVRRYGSTLEPIYNLFYNLKNAEDFTELFSQGRFVSAPSSLFDENKKAKKFKFTFSRCTSLEYIGGMLFASNIQAEIFESVFYETRALQAIPTGMFYYNKNAVNFKYAFSYSGIKKTTNCFPVGGKSLDMSYFASDCESLEEIAQDTFANLSQDAHVFKGAFRGCTSLKKIPEGLFDNLNRDKAHDFSSMFDGCTGLTGSAPPLWEMFPESSSSLYSWSCFRGCTGLSNYNEIPAGWK